MHIALTCDPEIPVPPKLYGGVERIVDMLARGLVARGHRVTLFAHSESRTLGRHVPWAGLSSLSTKDTFVNSAILARHIATTKFDLVHSYSRLAYMLPVLPLSLPKLMTYGRAISRRSVQLGHVLSRGTLHFSACSMHMMKSVEAIGNWHMVPNGVPLATYDFREHVSADAPLVFLGRIEEIKGPHLAIQVAKRAGLPLVIAGNVPAEYQGWYEQHVAPHIDGHQITYVGPVDDAQKNALLGRARAFLMPILWEEPFGIVMAEAMACGTPVIGTRRGSVPEIVEDGVTGYVVDTVDELVGAVGKVARIDRRAVRARTERLYSDDAVTEAYLAVYAKMLAGRRSFGKGV